MDSDLHLRHFSTVDDIPVSTTATVVPYTRGMRPEPRVTMQGDNSVVLTMLMTVMVVLLFVLRRSARFFRSATRSLFVVRTRENAFDERTINEDTIVVSLNFAGAFSGAILLNALLGNITDSAIGFTFLKLFGLISLFICSQYVAYWLIGYIFTSRNMAEQLLTGFNAVQSYLGLALLFPASAALFYPSAMSVLFTVAVVMYLVGRICFICKGFRIFYDNILSLLYFILYLCSAEIIPILLVYRMAADFCS